MQTPLLNLDWIAVDVETTGFSPSRDAILEIGFVRFDPRNDGQVLDAWSALTRPPWVWQGNESASKVHGIWPADIYRPGSLHRPIAEVMPEFLAELRRFKRPVLVAHKADFDRGFILAELERLDLRDSAGRIWASEPLWVDSLELATKLYPNQRPRTLEAMVRALHIQEYPEHFHRVRVDSEYCGRITSRMINQPSIITMEDVFACGAGLNTAAARWVFPED